MVRALVLLAFAPAVTGFAPAAARAGAGAVSSRRPSTETDAPGAESMDLDLAQMQDLFDAADADPDEDILELSRNKKRGNKNELPTLNGWKADMSAFCYGLPGALAPMGDFDPLGFSQAGVPLNDVRRYREAEVMHGRVSMVAAVGYLAGEAASPVVWNGAVSGPANDQLAQIPTWAFSFLTLAIGVAETFRARKGWVSPTNPDSLFELKEDYYPGDLGWDPLGLKPADGAAFAEMATKEIQNGRLAMIGVAGMCAQELVNHKTIAETYDFYMKVYSGVDPYAGV